MNTVNTSCFYHTGKTMVSICQKCRKPLCELDVNKGPHNYDLCYFCYTEQLGNGTPYILAVSLVCSACFLFVALMGFLSFVLSHVLSNGIFAIFLGLIGCSFVLLGLGVNVSNKNKLKTATTRYVSEPANWKILASNKTIQNIIDTGTKTSFKQTNNILQDKESLITYPDAITCVSCGQILVPDDVFCSNCGNRKM